MSHAFAVHVESPLATATDTDDISIKVNVDFGGNVTVSAPYVHVPEGGSRIITWTMETELSDVFFDSPAITMFGEDPDVDWLETSGTTQKLRWYNMNPAKQRRSYSYRIRLVRKTVIAGNPVFTPLSTDPIVRNDPPPAP